MSDDHEYRIQRTEEDVKSLTGKVDDLDSKIDKVVDILKRVQWTAMGVGVYFILDNLGLMEALKVAMKVVK